MKYNEPTFLLFWVFYQFKLYAMTSYEQLIPGVYQHYKGASYLVFISAKHTEAKEDIVVYTNITGSKQLWARPSSMFSEKVDFNGVLVPRFKFIRPLHHSEKLQIY